MRTENSSLVDLIIRRCKHVTLHRHLFWDAPPGTNKMRAVIVRLSSKSHSNANFMHINRYYGPMVYSVVDD